MAENLAAQFLLDPEVTFLNHGSYGACPRPVFAAYQRWQLQLERQPVAFLDPNRGLSAQMRASRTALAGEIGADPDDLFGTTNATTALNIVAQSLDLAPGDEILTTDHEYAALSKTWAYVCGKTGARIVAATILLPLTDAATFTESLLGAITPRTRVLFLSHITSATALCFPIAPIVAEARARGITTVIDGAHTPGHIALNLDALGADYYAGNCHKWLMAPKGTAFLHVRRDRQAGLNPLVISHGWNPDPQAPGPYGNPGFIDRFEMQGTRDPAAWLAVPEAIAFRHSHGWASVAAACQGLAQETAARITALTGQPPLSSPQFCAPQMVALPLPPCDPAALKACLLEKGIEIPCYFWQGRPIIRLSVQGYNDQADIDRLLQALSGFLKERII